MPFASQRCHRQARDLVFARLSHPPLPPPVNDPFIPFVTEAIFGIFCSPSLPPPASFCPSPTLHHTITHHHPPICAHFLAVVVVPRITNEAPILRHFSRRQLFSWCLHSLIPPTPQLHHATLNPIPSSAASNLDKMNSFFSHGIYFTCESSCIPFHLLYAVFDLAISRYW